MNILENYSVARGDIMQNIEELNLVTDKLTVEPNYSLENKMTCIEVYFNDAEQVLIVGVVDNNYIYWD